MAIRSVTVKLSNKESSEWSNRVANNVNPSYSLISITFYTPPILEVVSSAVIRNKLFNKYPIWAIYKELRKCKW